MTTLLAQSGSHREFARLSKALASRPRSSGSGCRACLPRCRQCRIQLTVTLLDPSGTEMALHRNPNMVRAIVGARHVKFLSGLAGSQSQDALAQARCAGFASR